MVVIFEGHDMSGKTTIANALASMYNTQPFMTNSKECFTNSIRSDSSKSLALFNYHLSNFILDIKEKELIDKPIIIYRSFLSEIVYSDLLNRKTDYGSIYKTDINFKKLNATIVLCKNKKKIKFNDELLNDKEVKKSIILFDEYKKLLFCDVFELDTSSENTDEHVKQIVDYINSKGEKL